METQNCGDSQAKIKVRLAILPEDETNRLDKTLAGEIAAMIANSNLLDQAPGYQVEVSNTKEAQGIPHEILVWIGIGAGLVGGKFVDAFIDKVVDKATERIVDKAAEMVVDKATEMGKAAEIVVGKVADLIEKIRKILNNVRYRKRQADIKVQFPHTVIEDIHERGPLADVLIKAGKQLTETNPDPKLPKLTENIEISLTITVSYKNSKENV